MHWVLNLIVDCLEKTVEKTQIFSLSIWVDFIVNSTGFILIIQKLGGTFRMK